MTGVLGSNHYPPETRTGAAQAVTGALRFFATAPRGVAGLLVAELRAMGAVDAAERPAGAVFSGTLELAYRACLWSRTANRVLLPLAEFAAPDPDALYEAVKAVAWEEHLALEGSLAVECALAASAAITHSRFAAQRVKDAVVDRFRELRGARPSVDLVRPDLRIHLHVRGDRATVSVDLSGASLHLRGYRSAGVAAPLKENLAAAILLRAGWPEVAENGGALLDPMCGSGTLLVEGAMIAADIAPGLLRTYFGFFGWLGHDAGSWERLLAEARERRADGLARAPTVVGYDSDVVAVRAALANVAQAGLHGCVHIERRGLSACEPPRATGAPGLVVVNPPYGRRLGTPAQLTALYAELGALLRRRFPGWRAAVFTANPELGRRIGLRAHRTHVLYNGAIECRLLHFAPQAATAGGAGAEMFANRLRKNLKTLGRWARREGVDCYRLYDADLPEYAVAVDLYSGGIGAGEGGPWVHVQEYEAPPTVDPAKAGLRLQDALAAVREVLEVPDGRVFLKVRRRQKGRDQYTKLAAAGRFHEVREGGLRFLVNFTDYLDTGLFLDHRPTRSLIRGLASGRRFLNLFGYTGTASVYAAAGGASSTLTVDLSRTYLDWARRNLALNGYTGPRHSLVQADCLEWLKAPGTRGAFDLIFLDPPTFSTSKRMRGTFDVQRDHVALIRDALRALAPGGVLWFSNNLRRFRLDTEALADLRVEDITRRTIPRDFARSPRIHKCWRIENRENRGQTTNSV